MSFYHFPSEFVFWDKVENHDEIKKEILPKILEDSKNKKNNPFSACKFNTSFKHNDKPDLNVMNKKMFDVIIFYLEKMFKTINFNVGKLIIKNGWWNVYDEGEFQEEHSHVGPPTYLHGDIFYPALSVIYILHDENEKSSIVFRKDGPFPLMEPHEKLILKTEDIKEIKEGTILIFPYNLRHLVKPCIKPGRVTLSYNILSAYK
jgi:hypothetical protein